MLLRNLRLWIIYHFNLNGPCMASKTKTSSHKVWGGKLTAQSIQRCVHHSWSPLQCQAVSSTMKMLLFGSNVILDSITRRSTAPAPAFKLSFPLQTGARRHNWNTDIKLHRPQEDPSVRPHSSTGRDKCETRVFESDLGVRKAQADSHWHRGLRLQRWQF